VVHDLGAGDLTLAAKLLGLGAVGVTAVDERAPRFKPESEKIRFIKKAYVDLNEIPRTAFVSWPPGVGAMGLAKILEGARTVLYLGNNFDGSLCGTPDLWAHLRSRKVLAHEPARRNTLIVYGAPGAKRDPLPEEEAAVDYRKIRQFDSVYGG